MLQGRPPRSMPPPSLSTGLSSPLAHSLLCSKENCFADQTHGARRRGRGGRADPQTDPPTGNESTHARTTAPRPSVGMPQISLAFSSCLLACSPAKSHFHLRTGRAARSRGHLLAKINRAACTYVGFASDVDDGKLFCVFVRDKAGRWRYIQSGP